MANASPPYARILPLVVILAGAAALVVGLVVLLLLVLGSADHEQLPDEPVPVAAPQPPAPGPAAPDAQRPPPRSSARPPARLSAAPVVVSPRPTGVIGVEECDELLHKLAACAARQVKENRRRHINGLLEVYRKDWIRAAKDREKLGTLVSSCNKAAAHFRITLAEARCEM